MPVVLATDIIVYILVAIVLYIAIKTRKQGYVRSALIRVRMNRLAVVSLVFLLAYGCVALADSIRWRDAITNKDGSPVLSPKGKPLYKTEPLSLLERALSNLRANTEKTFSAPLASNQYTKETIETVNGGHERTYARLKHPGTHLFGTGKVGNDVLYSALKGVRTGIVIGAGTTIIIVPFALFFGLIAGFYGGIIDDVIQYIYTTLSSIPGVLLIAAFMLLFGTGGYQGGLVRESDTIFGIFVLNDRLFWLCLIMGITSWTDLCRLVRAETLKLREMEYVQAARAFGVGAPGIITRHLAPNVMHLVLITMVLQFSGLVLAEAVLSYIGIGVGPEMGSWGNMINTGRMELSREPIVWWNLVAAFVFMFALVLPANIFADAVRDALDPRLNNK